MERKVKECPLCGFIPDIEDADFLYPVNKDKTAWNAVCPFTSGGCDAEAVGSSREEALANWNAGLVSEIG